MKRSNTGFLRYDQHHEVAQISNIEYYCPCSSDCSTLLINLNRYSKVILNTSYTWQCVNQKSPPITNEVGKTISLLLHFFYYCHLTPLLIWRRCCPVFLLLPQYYSSHHHWHSAAANQVVGYYHGKHFNLNRLSIGLHHRYFTTHSPLKTLPRFHHYQSSIVIRNAFVQPARVSG